MIPKYRSYSHTARTLRNRDKDIPLGDPFTIMTITDTHVYAAVDGNREAPGAYRDDDGRYYYTSGDKLLDFVSQVNVKKPDVVIHLGDMTELSTVGDFQLFNSAWDNIAATIPNFVIPGNHDAYQGYSRIENYIDVGERPIVCGSRFNHTETFFKNGMEIKIIFVDSNQDLNDNLIATSIAVLSDNKKTWLESEVKNMTADKVIIAIHHGYHSRLFDNKYFNSNDANWFNQMMNEAKNENPNTQFLTIFGHSHPVNTRTLKNETVLTGLNIPGALLWEESFYTEINLYQNTETLNVLDHKVHYPYVG